ncbi:hypothetical protein CVT24_002620 [Panaeolus cyanescens]|uniref:Uncharacterized protein n=1 Tax=Panaeolus cyanescens TaxID=181874 RepID=A0A409YU09_9AGAR|nr:hypothetical protein CVT24_002620 [Panaeolus cyanescens]
MDTSKYTNTTQEVKTLQTEFEERSQKLVESFMEREFELKRSHQHEMGKMQAAFESLQRQLDEIRLGAQGGYTSRPSDETPPVPLAVPIASPPSTPKRSNRAAMGNTPNSPANPARSVRRAQAAQPASTPTKSPMRGLGPKSQATPTKTQRKRTPVQYKLSPQDLKDSYISKAREIVNLHIRLLASLDTAASVPPDPSQETLIAFYRHFGNKSESDLAQHLRSGPTLIPEELVQIKSHSSYTGREKIRSALGRIEEHVIEYTRARLARFGFTKWTPNYNESPYALYNSAARMAALDTLKQALVAHAYAFTGVDALRLAKDMELLIKIYDHVVHYYFHDMYKKEKQDPGRVAEMVGQSPVYTSRNRLSAARIKFLESMSFPERLQKICCPKATSDDEEELDSAGRKIYVARQRPERSVAATALVRWIDEQIEKQAKMAGRSRRNRRIRMIPPSDDQKLTRFPTLPQDMPIDYFDVDYFNTEIPFPLRPKVADNTSLAFAHDRNITFVEGSRLSDAEIINRYAQQIIPQYIFLDAGDVGSDEDGDWVQDVQDTYSDDEDFEMELPEGEGGEIQDNESALDVEELEEYILHKREKLAAEFAMPMEDVY